MTCFNMGDIVREALQYVNPTAAKEEVADPKAKGKGKGSTPADQVADIFAGHDTTKYKELANQILKQIQMTTGNQDSIPGKNADIISLVSDDALLVGLFLQKLKFTFSESGKSQEDKDAEMRANVSKEKELLEELEAAQNAGAQEADPKAKGKPKAVKSVEDIQGEIDALLKAEVNGWILIDFPRNIS